MLNSLAHAKSSKRFTFRFHQGFSQKKKNFIFLYDAKSNRHAVIQEELIISQFSSSYLNEPELRVYTKHSPCELVISKQVQYPYPISEHMFIKTQTSTVDPKHRERSSWPTLQLRRPRNLSTPSDTFSSRSPDGLDSTSTSGRRPVGRSFFLTERGECWRPC